MEEIMSGTESEWTAEDSQDEFESIEVEATEFGENRASGITVSTNADDSLEPYADEPLADEAWLANYRKIQEEKLHYTLSPLFRFSLLLTPPPMPPPRNT